jgi:hypothetical protein
MSDPDPVMNPEMALIYAVLVALFVTYIASAWPGDYTSRVKVLFRENSPWPSVSLFFGAYLYFRGGMSLVPLQKGIRLRLTAYLMMLSPMLPGIPSLVSNVMELILFHPMYAPGEILDDATLGSMLLVYDPMRWGLLLTIIGLSPRAIHT